MPTVPHDTGIILVDHGSTVQAANDQLDHVVALFKRSTGTAIVEAAHMELARPTIADAVAACVDQGATALVIHPYFLAPGRHSTEDIPRMAREAAAQFGDIPCRVTEPLGLDERMCSIIDRRIAEALDRTTIA